MRKPAFGLLLTSCVLAASALAQTKAAKAPPVPPLTLYLAGTCTSCHGTDGKVSGTIPSLAGKEKAYLLEQLRLFKTDVLKVTLMNQLAKGFTDDELALLADYYAAQK